MLQRSRLRAVQRVAWAIVSLLIALPAWAQIDRGQVAGFVTDQQGAVVPGAAVTLVNTATQVVRTLTTDGQGYYIAVSLLPGVYDVSVELAGFKKATQTGVKVDATAKVALDVVLETGEISEVVTSRPARRPSRRTPPRLAASSRPGRSRT